MGQLNSKEGGVPLKQTERNLHWVLNENVKWTARAPQAMQLLGSGNARFHQSHERSLDEQTNQALADIDRLMMPAAASTSFGGERKSSSTLGLGGGSSSSSSSSSSGGLGLTGHHSHHGSSGAGGDDSRYGAGSNLDIFDPERPIALPLSHPAHQMLASQFFGAAATKEIVLAQNASSGSSSTSALSAQIAAAQAPQASEEQLTEWTRGRLERVHTMSKIDPHQSGALSALPPMMSSVNTPTSSSAASSGLNSAATTPRRMSLSGMDTNNSGITFLNPHVPLASSSTGGALDAGSSGPAPALTEEQARAARDHYEAPTMYDTVPAQGQTTTYPVGAGLAGVPHSATTEVLPSGGVDSSSGVGGAAEVAASRSSLATASASKERVELVTKYLYVSSLLDKMITSAQTSYQIALGMESLRKQLKPKRAKLLTQSAVADMQASFDEKRVLLRDNMELFDKSRLTLQWFITDFNLCYCLHVLHDTEVVTREQRDKLLMEQQEAAAALANASSVEEQRRLQLQAEQQRSNPNYAYNQGQQQTMQHQSSFSGAGAYGAQNTRTSSSHDIARLERVLSSLETRRAQIELRLQANERTALSIAHYYLSRHSSGAGLSIADAPELPSAYFSMLDLSHTGRVSREALQVTLCRLSETLDSLNARIQALQMHNSSMADGSMATAAAVGLGRTTSNPAMQATSTSDLSAPSSSNISGQSSNMQLSNALKIEKLEGERLATSQALRGISNYFLNVFVSNIFVNIGYAQVRENLDEKAVAAAEAASSAGGGGAALLQKPVLASEDINPSALLTDLASLDASNAQVLNPLDVANEGRVGPDETVDAALVGTGLPVDRTATTVDPARAEQIVREREQEVSLQPANAASTSSSPAGARNYGSTIAARLARLKEIEAQNLHPASHAAQEPREIHQLLEQQQQQPLTQQQQASVLNASPDSAQLQQRPITTRQATDLTMLSNRPRRALPTPPTSRAVSLPIHSAAASSAPRNAVLAPAVHPSDLQQAHLEHVPAEAIQPSIYGGQHDRSMAPSALGAAPVDGGAGTVPPVNAALAPVVDSKSLERQSASLSHVPLTVDNVTDFGGITMHPGVFASSPEDAIVQADPLQEEHAAIVEGQKPIDELPAATVAAAGAGGAPPQAAPGLAEDVLRRSQAENAALLAAPTPIPSAAGNISLDNNPVWAEPTSLADAASQVKQERHYSAEAGPVEPVALVMPAPTVVLAEQNIADVPPTVGANAALAPLVTSSDLKKEKKALEHVKPSESVPSDVLGSRHMAGAVLPPSRAALEAEKAQLAPVAHKLERADETLAGGKHLIAQPDLAHTVPEQAAVSASSDVQSNAALAPLVHSADLAATHDFLERVTGVQPSQWGGVHQQGAQLGVGPSAVDRIALQYVKAHELTHVPIDKAPVTASGGVHLLGQPDLSHTVPEQVDIAGPSDSPSAVSSNAALANAIHPAELAAGRGHLEAVLERVHVQPSRYGGVHAEGAQTGVLADPVALKYVKEHELTHVPIERAEVTASGGVHLIGQPDTTRVPEAADAVTEDGESPTINAALAPAIRPTDLRYERRALEHVPIERQVGTSSGGLHMADASATVPLSLMDRVKSALGMETHAEQAAANAPIEGLGRVVERVPVAIEAHTVDEATISQQQQQGQLQGLQQGQPQVRQVQEQEQGLVSANKSLAPLICPAELVQERARLHHVSLERLELKRDLAAGVGQVTTRRATPRAQLRGSIAGQKTIADADAEESAFDFRQSASASAPTSAVPSPRGNRLPLVTGRSASTTNSPRNIAMQQQQQPRAAIVEVAPVAAAPVVAPVVDSKLPASDALEKELWSEGQGVRSSAASSADAMDLKNQQQQLSASDALNKELWSESGVVGQGGRDADVKYEQPVQQSMRQ